MTSAHPADRQAASPGSPAQAGAEPDRPQPVGQDELAGVPLVQVWTDRELTPEPQGELELIGRLTAASNATFLARDQAQVRWIYKPLRGEAPLWDFPTGTLGQREIAAYALSLHAGFHVVPPTVRATGPYGVGSAQLWVDDAEDDVADLVLADELRQDWCSILVGVDQADREVALIHADLAGLRRLALFDLVANNADRKGAHILHRADGSILGVDHGLTFHAEPKLRTILWGWAEQEFSMGERELLLISADVATPALSPWLADDELEAVHGRIADLLDTGGFPAPEDDRPMIPWPPL